MDGILGQDRLHVSEGTVRNHVSRIIAKLQTNDLTQAVAGPLRRVLVYLRLRVTGDSRLRVNSGSTGTYCVGFSLTPVAAATIMTLRHNTLAAGTMQGS
jgi:hypothetical protein